VVHRCAATTTRHVPLAELSAAALFYETAGAGPPVLLIGGTGGDLRRAPGPFAWPGAERFSVLAFDHRDQGRSRSHAAAQPTMADFASDALELTEHLGWDRFDVVGYSFGGMVAQELALAARERVGRLVLVATSSGGDGCRSYPLHELYELEPAARTAALVELLDTRATTQPQLAAAIASYLAVDRALSANDVPPPGLVRQLAARRDHDSSARLGALQMPALVIAGRFDGIATPATCEALARALPDAQLQVYEGGHAVLLQDPDAWPAIARFLVASARRLSS
jgi:3-oxoadipate enol-lactonase